VLTLALQTVVSHNLELEYCLKMLENINPDNQ